MIANRSIKQTKYVARDLNPVLITVIISLIIVIPQYGLGLIMTLGQIIPASENFLFFFYKNDLILLLELYQTALALLLAYIFASKVLKRDRLSLGLVEDKKLSSYAKGLVLGFTLISLIILILKLTGLATIKKSQAGLNLKIFLAFLLGWLIQGFEEEFLMRSILMNQMAAMGKVEIGIVANSLIFSIFHLGNDGFNFLALVNIFMMGLVFSLIFYLTDSIYIPAAAHSLWNMTMGNIYGIAVSGNSPIGASIFITKLEGPAILTGARFGLEASIITTLVLAIFLIILMRKTKQTDLAR